MAESIAVRTASPATLELFPAERASRRKRVLLIALALLLAGGGAFGAYQYSQSFRKAGLRFDTVKVDRGRIISKVTATGTLSALVTVQVGSQVSGTLTEILVDFNAEVKKGQVLARIDPRLFEAALEQAKANVAAEKGNLAKARAQKVDADRQYSRTKALAEKDVSAQADVDTAQANAEAAKAQVEAAEGSLEQVQAALNQAVVNLGYTTIISPINGQVISRNVDMGQTVAASLQAPTLFQIAEDLRRMQVDTSVAEADVGKLKAEMEATFTVDAYPGERFRGKVRQVRKAPQMVQNVVTYDAVIDVENPELKLMPGMTATITFVCQDKDGVLRVPNAALRFRPPPEMLAAARSAAGGKSPDGEGAATKKGAASGAGPIERAARTSRASDQRTVWLLRDGAPQVVTVPTGISDSSFTELTEATLQEGDQVITDAFGGEAAGAGRGSSIRRLF